MNDQLSHSKELGPDERYSGDIYGSKHRPPGIHERLIRAWNEIKRLKQLLEVYSKLFTPAKEFVVVATGYAHNSREYREALNRLVATVYQVEGALTKADASTILNSEVRP